MLANLDFKRFWRFGEKTNIYIRIEAQELSSIIDTICNYIFHFGPPGKYLWTSRENRLSAAGFAGRRIVDFWDLRIDIFLEVQNQKYPQILYLMHYIAYGPQFPHRFWNSPKSAQIPKCVIVTSGLKLWVNWFRKIYRQTFQSLNNIHLADLSLRAWCFEFN